MPNNKSIKKRQLSLIENWVGIDVILFDKTSPRKQLKEKYDEYKKYKSALLMNLYEIYQLIDYKQTNTYENLNKLAKTAKINSKKALEESVELIQSNDVKKEIQRELNESLDANKELIVKKHIMRTALDKFMLETALLKMKKGANIFNNGKGKLLLAAYRSFRDDILDKVIK